MKANRNQIAKIHIARKQLNLDENDYRNALMQYGVEHANELSYSDAVTLLENFEKAGFVVKPKNPKPTSPYGFGKNKYEMFAGRGKPWATPETLRHIEGLWRTASKTKTDESLQKFIFNRTGISHISFLHHSHAKIIINALNVMQEKKSKEAFKSTKGRKD